MLAGPRHVLAGLRISTHSRRAKMQRKTADPADLDSFAARERFAHELENVLDRELDVFGGKVLLIARDRFDQLGFCHRFGPFHNNDLYSGVILSLRRSTTFVA